MTKNVDTNGIWTPDLETSAVPGTEPMITMMPKTLPDFPGYKVDYDKLKEDTSSKWAVSKTGAQRQALGVPYMRQVPLEAMAAGAAALEYGAKKYANRNWEKGLPWQQMIDSLKRHIDDFERGDNFDDGPDGSDLHQVCMIMASAMMLSASVIREIGEDDRMPETPNEAFSAKDCAKWMKEQLDNARPTE